MCNRVIRLNQHISITQLLPNIFIIQESAQVSILIRNCDPLFLFVASKLCRIPIPENISIIRRTLFFTAQSMNIATDLSGTPSQSISRAMSTCLLAPITANRSGFRSCLHSRTIPGTRAMSCTRDVKIISLVRNERTFGTTLQSQSLQIDQQGNIRRRIYGNKETYCYAASLHFPVAQDLMEWDFPSSRTMD